MAEYCEISDLIAEIDEDDLVKLASKADEATIADQAVTDIINAQIVKSGAEIDSYLLGRYGE